MTRRFRLLWLRDYVVLDHVLVCQSPYRWSNPCQPLVYVMAGFSVASALVGNRRIHQSKKQQNRHSSVFTPFLRAQTLKMAAVWQLETPITLSRTEELLLKSRRHRRHRLLRLKLTFRQRAPTRSLVSIYYNIWLFCFQNGLEVGRWVISPRPYRPNFPCHWNMACVNKLAWGLLRKALIL